MNKTKEMAKLYEKDVSGELKQCPYNKACKCLMDEECEGCEEWRDFGVAFNTIKSEGKL